MKIVLCRHTETDFNVQKKYTGHIDIPLNKHGVEQAKILAEQLSSFKFSAAFCSDLLRATQTAQIIITGRQLVLNTDPRLREVCLGSMDGLTKETAKKLYPEERFSTRSTNFDFSLLGGESREQVVKNHQNCLDEIFDEYGSSDFAVLIVGHGTALRAFLEYIGIESLLEQGNYQTIDYYPESN